MTPRACHNFRVKLASLILTVTAGLNGQRLGMRAKNFVFNRGVSCFIRGVSCFIRGVSCFIRGVSCFIRCILSCFIRYNPVFQSWSSRRERVNVVHGRCSSLRVTMEGFPQHGINYVLLLPAGCLTR